MALQSNGPISLGDIRTELGISSNDFSLHNAEFGTYVAINRNSTLKPNGLNPNSISEWYGYDHGGGGIPSLFCQCVKLVSTTKSARFVYYPCNTSDPRYYYDAGLTKSILVSGYAMKTVCVTDSIWAYDDPPSSPPNYPEHSLVQVVAGTGYYEWNEFSDCCNNTTTSTSTTTTYKAVQLYYNTIETCPTTTNLATRYINGTSFNSRNTTKIYTNTSGTLAPAGYYQDVNGINRYWNGNSLDFATLC